MADGVRCEISGLRELEAALRQLGGPVARSAMRAAARAGANVIREEARARVPVDTGLVWRNIVARVRRDERTATGSAVRFSVGVLTRKGRGRVKKGRSVLAPLDRAVLRDTLAASNPYYWYYIERGTRRRPAHPFLRPALETKSASAMARMQAVLWDRINRATRLTARIARAANR